jgi:tetratricopeptide (TPR) repeat protein
MKWSSLILSLILTAGLAMAHPPAGLAQSARENTEARKLWTEGNELYNDGNFAEAEKKFREALTKYPKAEQSDRTAYYLIITLEKLRRLRDARTEIENFHRNFPGSRWRQDVDEKSLAIGGLSANDLLAQEQKIAKERQESERRGSPALPPNASMDAAVLQMIIQMDPNAGIEKIRERLKIDPSDPAVIANIGTIFSSNSPQALPFLLELANSASSPHARTIAFFFAMRRNPDKEQVARTLMEMLEKKENEPIVSEALFQMTYIEHRAVLAKIVASSKPDKFDAIEKIYRGGSVTLRSDLLDAVAKLKDDPRAEAFITDAAQNDKDLAVRRAAMAALIRYKGGADVKTLENLLSPSPPRPPVVRPRGAPTVPGSTKK